MTLLQLDPENLAARGAAHTAHEIAQQPDVWEAVHRLVTRRRGALDAFLSPLLALPELRIVLTGAGSSAFIGQCLAPVLLRQLGSRPGLRVEAIATTDIVSNPGEYLQASVPTLLVSFARSGNSPESLAAVELADRLIDTCRHLVVTCAADGALNLRLRDHARAEVLLLPDETHDRAFAMTSSFSGMLLAAAWAFALPTGLPQPLAQAARRLLTDQTDRLRALSEQSIERVVYLGSGSLQGVAREAALKLLELTDGRVVGTADSTLGFRHGPKTILNDRTLVIVILSNAAHTRQYDLDLVRELRQQKRAARVLAIGVASPTDSTSGATHSEDDVVIDLPVTAPDLALAPVALIFAQCLALLASLRLGLTPDNPSVSGTVSRVVSGVTIYSYTRQSA
jgi:tagatose-6-phosphate ketose/aldose isomerase